MVAGAVEHPPQPWDSREEGEGGEGRAREGKGEKERGGVGRKGRNKEGGGVPGGERPGRSGRAERLRDPRSTIGASFTHQGVLSIYMQAWARDKARTV